MDGKYYEICDSEIAWTMSVSGLGFSNQTSLAWNMCQEGRGNDLKQYLKFIFCCQGPTLKSVGWTWTVPWRSSWTSTALSEVSTSGSSSTSTTCLCSRTKWLVITTSYSSRWTWWRGGSGATMNRSGVNFSRTWRRSTKYIEANHFVFCQVTQLNVRICFNTRLPTMTRACLLKKSN